MVSRQGSHDIGLSRAQMFWTVCPHYPVYSRHQSLPAADSNTQRHAGYLRSQLLGKLHVNRTGTGDRGCFNQSFNACGCVNSKEYDCALLLGCTRRTVTKWYKLFWLQTDVKGVWGVINYSNRLSVGNNWRPRHVLSLAHWWHSKLYIRSKYVYLT